MNQGASLAGTRPPGLVQAGVEAAGAGAGLAGAQLVQAGAGEGAGLVAGAGWVVGATSLAGSAETEEDSEDAGRSDISVCNMRGAANIRRERSWLFMWVGWLDGRRRRGLAWV